MTEKIERDLEGIINKSPAVVFLWRNSEGWPVEFVSKNVNQFGYTQDDFYSGKVIYEQIVHPDDLERVAEEVINNSNSDVSNFVQEYRIITKSGDIKWLDDRTWIRRDSKGNITHFQGIVLDITQRKYLEENLKKSEEKYRLISENANDLISVFDEKFNFEYVNENIHKSLMGYNKEDLIGKNGIILIHPDDQNLVLQSFKELINTGEGLVIARIRHKNGKYVWTETKGKTFYDTMGKRKMLLITRDITERKQSTQKLMESEEKYRIAYEHENFYKDLFTHDIKNILQGVLSALELFKLKMKSMNEEIKNQDLFNDIENQISRGSNLIKNVRKFSEFDKFNKKLGKVDLIKTIENAFENVKHYRKEKKINVTYDLFSESTIIYANNLLNDAVENILLNAIIHNENTIVEILIRTTAIKKDHDAFIKIEFIDNGRGIPKYKKELIFERGFNQEKETTGMGLGLSLVKIILKVYKAKICVEDKIPGDYTKGSNFIILFPEVSV